MGIVESIEMLKKGISSPAASAGGWGGKDHCAQEFRAGLDKYQEPCLLKTTPFSVWDQPTLHIQFQASQGYTRNPVSTPLLKPTNFKKEILESYYPKDTISNSLYNSNCL